MPEQVQFNTTLEGFYVCVYLFVYLNSTYEVIPHTQTLE